MIEAVGNFDHHRLGRRVQPGQRLHQRWPGRAGHPSDQGCLTGKLSRCIRTRQRMRPHRTHRAIGIAHQQAALGIAAAAGLQRERFRLAADAENNAADVRVDDDFPLSHGVPQARLQAHRLSPRKRQSPSSTASSGR